MLLFQVSHVSINISIKLIPDNTTRRAIYPEISFIYEHQASRFLQGIERFGRKFSPRDIVHLKSLALRHLFKSPSFSSRFLRDNSQIEKSITRIGIRVEYQQNSVDYRARARSAEF
jgi:hypothetical protein